MFYAAIDLSMEECHVCIVDAQGSRSAEGVVGSSPNAIHDFLVKHAQAPDQLNRRVIESGRKVPYIYHGLVELGWPVVCVESIHAHRALAAARLHKTDENDARGLAELARIGFYREVHVKSFQAHGHKFWLTARRHLVQARVDIENCIRSLCSTFGIIIGSKSGKAFDKALEPVWDIPDLALSIRALHDSPQQIMTSIKSLEQKINTHCKMTEPAQRLMEIPGVGMETALCFLSVLDDPTRFGKSRDVGAYLGLVPRRQQSGESDYTGKISKHGDKHLRSLLYEAANSILTRCRQDFPLKRWAAKLAQRKGLSLFETARSEGKRSSCCVEVSIGRLSRFDRRLPRARAFSPRQAVGFRLIITVLALLSAFLMFQYGSFMVTSIFG